MICIPISTVENAEFLSRQLYKMTRPVKDPGDVTEFYCGWHVHPQSRAVVVALPEVETVPVDAAADTTLLDPLLMPFVAQGAISDAGIVAMRQQIADARGTAVNLASLLPAFWAAQAMTRAQAEAAGWFTARQL
jgi:hypothetical protein